jgi:hypothetical protein
VPLLLQPVSFSWAEPNSSAINTEDCVDMCPKYRDNSFCVLFTFGSAPVVTEESGIGGGSGKKPSLHAKLCELDKAVVLCWDGLYGLPKKTDQWHALAEVLDWDMTDLNSTPALFSSFLSSWLTSCTRCVKLMDGDAVDMIV